MELLRGGAKRFREEQYYKTDHPLKIECQIPGCYSFETMRLWPMHSKIKEYVVK